MTQACRSALLLLIFVAFAAGTALATHLRAGEITATRVSCSGRTFLITVTVYIDTQSGVLFGGPSEILNFGDGTFIEVPETSTTPRPDLGESMGTASFTIEHTYAGPGTYLIRYVEPNRNEDILNVQNSVETTFYIESTVVIDPLIGCNNTPRLLVPPIDRACTGAAWYHNPGAFDVDGDSLSFHMIVPYQSKDKVVDNYRYPDAQEFYTAGGINYATANETGDGPPDITIDPVKGTIIWNAPGAQGEYNIAFLVKEWRKVRGTWVQIGYVERDMQIIVEDCMNQRPELIVPEDICVEAGTKITQEIFGFDPDSDNVKIEGFSETLILGLNRATLIPSPAVFQPSSPSNHAKVTYQWQTDCAHVRQQPYLVTFKITDKPKVGTGAALVQFKTWSITVVGPAPQWESASVPVGTRNASLAWDPYVCQNATTIEVWRRVDKFPYTPPECVTGIPDFLGYTKIADVPASQSTYNDTNNGKGLAIGAQYCYRLVAVYPTPGNGVSYVSEEICLDPIRADVPIITNVTVDRTSNQDGAITVRWRKAYDLNPAQFPPPYSYEVLRAEGITGNIKIIKPHSGRLSDTTYTDTQINTKDLIYNYRVILFDGNNTRIDTSDVASMVRLEARPEIGSIKLTWIADVPWSNRTEKYPWHLIYRGSQTSTEAQMTLIDSVNVNQFGFTYTDVGKYQNTPLNESTIYSYRVMTRGAYGNPRIVEPLRNFSQILLAQPNDTIPPCKPTLEIIAQSCDDPQRNLCGETVFSNTIRWKRPDDPNCVTDIVGYNVLIADKIGGEFRPYVENVRDTFYIDQNTSLKSFARCYKIEAVDRSGNKSELSGEFCFDNCPNYELPNVFTPNGDGCNDMFVAFGDPINDGGCQTPQDPNKCARFVLRVEFTVYDRWGKAIYTLDDSKERSIYVRWNGLDNDFKEVPTGVYYYIANVQFDTVDPKQEFKEIKGWVHLVRGKAE